MASKWADQLPQIRDLIDAGRTAPEIAETLGTTVGNLYKICHRNGISIPRSRAYTKRLPPLEIMAEALRQAGYVVAPPPQVKPLFGLRIVEDETVPPGKIYLVREVN